MITLTTDLVFYLGFCKQRKFFLSNYWFQKIPYNSLFPQPIPSLDVYNEKLPCESIILRKIVFFCCFFCLQLRILGQKMERVNKVERFEQSSTGALQTHMHWKACKGSSARLPGWTDSQVFRKCTCLEGCSVHRKFCFSV